MSVNDLPAAPGANLADNAANAPPPRPHPPDVPWSVWEVWFGLGLAGLAVAGLIVYVILHRDFDLGLLVSLGELTMLLPIVVIVFLRHRLGWGALGLRRFPYWALLAGVGLMFLVGLVNIVYGLVLTLFGLQVQASLQELIDQLKSPWWFLVGGALVAPIVEEIFFRGFVFAGFRRRYGWVRAAVFSSILFALVHGELTALPPIFLLGLLFAVLYEYSGAIWTGMILHVANNALSLALVYIALRYNLPV